MLDPDHIEVVEFDADERPMLQIVVDAEEEFDWDQPFSRTSNSVSSIRQQDQAHYTFDRYGVVPTYVVDYPVASQADGYGLLRELLAAGKCEIGAQLHPWVNPPYDEQISERNSYPGNLPAALEEEKLKRLTGAIERSFGIRPTVYKAGRYGVGPNTAEILVRLGYEIDTSVLPARDLRRKGGPDFRRCTARPYWFGPGRRLLELPLTAGVIGAWSRSDLALHLGRNSGPEHGRWLQAHGPGRGRKSARGLSRPQRHHADPGRGRQWPGRVFSGSAIVRQPEQLLQPRRHCLRHDRCGA